MSLVELGLARSIAAQVTVGLMLGDGAAWRARSALEVIGLFVLNAVDDADRPEIARTLELAERTRVVSADP